MFSEIAECSAVGPPDWFVPRALTTTPWQLDSGGVGGCGLVAFCSKPYVHIFLLRGRSDGMNCGISYVGQIQPHHERISGLSFCVPGGGMLDTACLVTCGDDGLVRNWTYQSPDWLLTEELNVSSVKDKLTPTALSTCARADDVCSMLSLIGTNTGHIIVWSHSEVSERTKCCSKRFENEAVQDCAWESKPGSSAVKMAIGYKKGIVGLYTYQSASVTSAPSLSQINRFYTHEKDICHISWSPYYGSDESADPVNPDLLTCGRDQFLKLWNSTSASCCASIKVLGKQRGGTGTPVQPPKPDRGAGRSNSIGAPWITGAWLLNTSSSPSHSHKLTVLVSGLRGEIYQSSDDCQLRQLTNELGTGAGATDSGHSMLIFSMSPILHSPGLFVTISQDRQVLLWQHERTAGSLRLLLHFPTIPAGVSALAQSDYGSGPIAVGMNNGSVVLWKHSSATISLSAAENEKNTPTETGGVGDSLITLWPRGQSGSNITALAWHPLPQFENLLAYGNEAGCVKLIDVNKLQRLKNQKSKSQPYFLGSTVYRVAWGPSLFDLGSKNKSDHKPQSQLADAATVGDTVTDVAANDNSGMDVDKFSFFVYSVCKGKLFCYLGFHGAPIDITLKFPIVPVVTPEEWKSDKRGDISFLWLDKQRQIGNGDAEDTITSHFDCLVAVGYRSGNVDVYARRKCNNPDLLGTELAVVCRIATHTKGINCMAWSPSKYWLAIGSNEHFITVTDICASLLALTGPKETAMSTSFPHFSSCMARLEGHSNRITCLDWSPHCPNLLLSASFDGTANVWNVAGNTGDFTEINATSTKTAVSVANFRAHRLRLFACLWDRHQTDLAFSGGEMCHLFGWRPSRLHHTAPPNCRRHRPPPIKRITSNTNEANSCLGKEESILSSVPLASENKEREQRNGIVSQNHQPAQARDSSTSNPVPTKTSTADKRKRPPLFPGLFHRAGSVETCQITLNTSPPITPCSKWAQLLLALNQTLNYDDAELPESDRDLVFLLPDGRRSRRTILQLVQQEADNHLETYRQQTVSRATGLLHLDAYCMLMLWIGRVSLLPRLMVTEQHMPFWLLWAVQLAQTTHRPFCADSQSVDTQGVDLIGQKVKELSSCNPGDVLIGATLLMCAGRSREAIDYLVGSDRVKDALLLARIRLPSTELRDTIHLCVTRMSERRLVTDVPFVEAIYSVGEGALERAKSLCHRITVSGGTAGSRCSPAVELLSHAWTDVCLLSRETTTHQSKGLSIAYVHLVTPCLTQGFLLLPSANAASVYFQRWIDALSDSPTDCPGYFCILLLLDVAHAIVRTDPDGVQWSQFDSGIWLNGITGRGCDGDDGPNEILLVLNQLVSERQPSNDWVVSVVNSVVDTVACYVSAHDLQCTGESRRHYLSRVHDSLTELVAVMDRSSEDSSAIVGRMKALVESLPCQTAPLPCSVGGVPTTHS